MRLETLGGERVTHLKFPPMRRMDELRLPDDPPDWVWPGWLARGHLTVWEADDPAVLTSAVAALAVAVAAGDTLPDRPGTGQPARVVVLDPPQDGAGVDREDYYAAGDGGVLVATDFTTAGGEVLPPSQVAPMGVHLAANLANAALVVIDKWDALAGPKPLPLLRALVDRLPSDAAVLVARRRPARGPRPPAGVRMILAPCPGSPGGWAVGCEWSALGPVPPSGAFVQDRDCPMAPLLPAGQPVPHTATDLLARMAGGAGAKRAGAADWLTARLAGGPAAAAAVEADARADGISPATLKRAKAAAGVLTRQRPNRQGWEWYLPAAPGENRTDPGEGVGGVVSG